MRIDQDRKPRACGHDDCGVSSGICGALKFGRGALDYYGYWEVPCRACAESFEKENPNFGVWPTEEKTKT